MSDLDVFTDAELEAQCDLHHATFDRLIGKCEATPEREVGSDRYLIAFTAANEQHELFMACSIELARRFAARFPATAP